MPMPDGTVPEGVIRAFDDGLFALPLRPSPLSTSATQSVWHVPVLMISFSDDPFDYTPAQFDYGLFDTTQSTPWGSVYDYYQWASGGRLEVVGNVVANVTLPHTRFYYAFGNWGLSTGATPSNMYGAIRDALQLSEASVRWSDYDIDRDGFVDMLWVLHSGIGGESGLDRNAFWSITSRLSGGWRYGESFVTTSLVPGTTSQYTRIDRFSTVPELSALIPGARAEIGVFCHEFGHALGLPDLYDTSQLGGGLNVGPGNWSLMSTGAYGTNGITPENPSLPGAWPMLYLGWTQSVRPTEDTTITLGAIEQGAPVIDFSYQGDVTSEHILIEHRRREHFDRYLPAEGLLLYQVDENGIGQRLASNRINAGLTPGLRLIEADGDDDLLVGRNRGDANDPFPGALGRAYIDDAGLPSTRSISGAVTNTAVRDITPVGDRMRFTAEVRAPGWLPPEDHTRAGYQPVHAYPAATTTMVGADGILQSVGSEASGGISQIILHSRGPADWLAEQAVSQSPTGAFEPTLLALSNGDLAIAWRDTRGGRSRLYYRARIRGGWTPEQVLVDLPGDSYAPALGGDGHGYVYATWLQIASDRPRIKFMRFTYLSPFGDPLSIADSTSYPGPPTLAVGRDGHAYIIWPERSKAPQVVRFSYYHPDSGLRAPRDLGVSSSHSQVAVAAVLDSAGVLHSILQISGSGVNELHYQAREPVNPSWLRDTLIESQSSDILGLTLAMDSSGGLHLVYETTRSGAQQIRYRRFVRGKGWDFRSTEVTRTDGGDASQPRLGVWSPGNLDVLYTLQLADGPHFAERRRLLDGPLLLAVDSAPGPARGPLRMAPNPIRPGQALEVSWAGSGDGAGPTEVDFYDVAGRRVASLALVGPTHAKRARLGPEATARWSSGLYFARARGPGLAATRLVVIR